MAFYKQLDQKFPNFVNVTHFILCFFLMYVIPTYKLKNPGHS